MVGEVGIQSTCSHSIAVDPLLAVANFTVVSWALEALLARQPVRRTLNLLWQSPGEKLLSWE